MVGILICGALLLDRRPVLYEASDGHDTPGATEVDITDDDTPQTDDSSGTAPVAFATAATNDIGAPSLRLEIRTTGPCWVSASADGERAVYRLIQAGERAQVEAHKVITLRVGDAGAFAYTVNGTAGRPLWPERRGSDHPSDQRQPGQSVREASEFFSCGRRL